MWFKLAVTIACSWILVGCGPIYRGEETVSEYAAGTAITTKIKATYARDSRVSMNQIGVETRQGGVVILSGVVQDPHQKRIADHLARKVDGVTKVINKIVLVEDIKQ